MQNCAQQKKKKKKSFCFCFLFFKILARFLQCLFYFSQISAVSFVLARFGAKLCSAEEEEEEEINIYIYIFIF